MCKFGPKMKSVDLEDNSPPPPLPVKLKKSKAICHLNHLVAILQHRLPLPSHHAGLVNRNTTGLVAAQACSWSLRCTGLIIPYNYHVFVI